MNVGHLLKLPKKFWQMESTIMAGNCRPSQKESSLSNRLVWRNLLWKDPRKRGETSESQRNEQKDRTAFPKMDADEQKY